MRSKTHKDIARCVSREVAVFADAGVREQLERGSIYPDPDARDTEDVPAGITFAAPHHRWTKYGVSRERSDVVGENIMRARKCYLRGECRDAAFRLGVALHYLADDFVPWGGDGDNRKKHNEYEAEAARATPKLREVPSVQGKDATFELINETTKKCELHGEHRPAREAVSECATVAVALARAVVEPRDNVVQQAELDAAWETEWRKCAETYRDLWDDCAVVSSEMARVRSKAVGLPWIRRLRVHLTLLYLGALLWVLRARRRVCKSMARRRAQSHLSQKLREMPIDEWYLRPKLKDPPSGDELEKLAREHHPLPPLERAVRHARAFVATAGRGTTAICVLLVVLAYAMFATKPCPDCNGNGWVWVQKDVPVDTWKPCPDCNDGSRYTVAFGFGAGWAQEPPHPGYKRTLGGGWEVCPNCQGKGWVRSSELQKRWVQETCQRCDGSGRVRVFGPP